MKAVVMSDSHKDFDSILKIMNQESDANYIIHAGDVQQDIDDMESVWSTLPIAYVLGNNDFFVTNVPTDRLFTLGEKKIFLTHGHMYAVKHSLSLLTKKAKEVSADICIFGHTHTPFLEMRDGIWFLNPGSTRRSYATIDFQRETPLIEIKKL